MDRLDVDIYIRGSFKGNPRGRGEAEAVVKYIDKEGGSHKRVRRVQVELGTRNALMLKACNAAMRMLLKPCSVTIHMDCGYIENAVRLGWLGKWQQAGWRKADGSPPANAEEWKQFHMLSQIHAIAFASNVEWERPGQAFCEAKAGSRRTG